ncbi:hypothetical protein RF11_05460 [Thelohanellus kitauei]|uniref:Uncharacterized protein n=1 Tax=Thelohanellus kitauei TaxID=669202 RepID=A0A0C2MLY2_THEKT|nr:hypothetical protein RF11_05460 [Thelohanellus kitauei]
MCSDFQDTAECFINDNSRGKNKCFTNNRTVSWSTNESTNRLIVDEIYECAILNENKCAIRYKFRVTTSGTEITVKHLDEVKGIQFSDRLPKESELDSRWFNSVCCSSTTRNLWNHSIPSNYVLLRNFDDYTRINGNTRSLKKSARRPLLER